MKSLLNKLYLNSNGIEIQLLTSMDFFIRVTHTEVRCNKNIGFLYKPVWQLIYTEGMLELLQF